MWLYVVCLMLAVGSVSGMSPVITCTDGKNSRPVPLNCTSSEMIHVESITYYNGSDCTQAIADKTICRPPSTNTSLGLAPQCNGKNTSCDEFVLGCQAAEVDYRCIKDTEVYNMCDDDLNKDNINHFFLSTPNFPQLSPLITSAPCICYIRGTNITSINILDLRLTTTGDATGSNLLINYGDKSYNKTSHETTTRRVVNDYLTVTDLTSFTVQLNHNMNKVITWMEIHGRNMAATCSSDGSTTTLATTFPPTTTTTTTTTTSIPDTTTVPTSTTSTTSTPTPVVPTSTLRQTTLITRTTTSPPTTTTKTFPSTETTTSPLTTTANGITGDDDNLPKIAGAVGAAVVLIVVVVIIVIVCKRRHNSYYDKPLNSEEDDSPDYRHLAKNGDEGGRGVTHSGFVESRLDEGVDLDDNSSDINSGRVQTMTNGVEYTVVNKPRISGRKPVNSQTIARGDEEIQYADIDPGVQYADIDTAATYADIDTSATYGGTELQVVPSDAVYAQVKKKSKSLPGQDNSPPHPGQDNSPPLPVQDNSPPLPVQDNSPPLPCHDNSPHDQDNSSDLILLENPMYVSMEDAQGMSGGPGTFPTQTNTDTTSQEPDTLEILENALYVPLEEMQKWTT